MHHPIRSGGPRTDTGKAASSQNATRHGLTARTHHTLRNENPEVWARVVVEHVKAYGPANAVEHALVEEIAFASWKLRRLVSIETGLFDIAMETQASELAQQLQTVDEPTRLACAFEHLAEDGSRALALFTRYHTQIERSRDRSIKTLRELQDRRTKALAEEQKAGEKNEIRPSKPSNPEQNQQLEEIAKRTTQEAEPIRSAAIGEPETGPYTLQPCAGQGPNGGMAHDKAA
jgi:hypothetical protein